VTEIRKRRAERWRAIRKSKANLAPVITGCMLLVLAFAWRFAIAPSIKVVAGDFDQLYFYEGVLTTYINPPGRPAPAGAKHEVNA